MAAADVPANGGAGGAACHAAARQALQRRTLVAAYYELKLALTAGRVIEWTDARAPREVMRDAVQVAVSASHGFAVDARARLLAWRAGEAQIDVLLDSVVWVAAGDSGILAIRCDGSLWHGRIGGGWKRESDEVVHAWVGDGADYYVRADGLLFVRGLAHRGQYGNGVLKESPGWTQVASDALAVAAHTGHALYLRRDGAVLGTGGNRFGPLGNHGFGDKADRWGVIFTDAVSLATGSRHSLAIRSDGSVWIWGDAAGLQPRRVLENAAAAAGGMHDSVVLMHDASVWVFAPGKQPARLALPP
ncbi:MAG: hypothetical protein ABIN37_13050 [Burkholderiaceae bacterium]